MSQKKTKSKENRKKKVMASAAVTTASIGALLGSSFETPEELLKDPNVINPPAIVEIYNNRETSEEIREPVFEDEKKSFKDVVKGFVYRIPVPIRAILCLPLWAIGWLIINALTGLWSHVLTPVFSTIGDWILTALFILLAVLVGAKAVFPDLPIKKILNRKTILGTIIGVALLAIIDKVLPLFFSNYMVYRNIAILIGGFIIVAILMIPFLKRYAIKHQVASIN